jgi:hypothetical protein
MNNQKDTSGNLLITLGKVLCIAALASYPLTVISGSIFHWGYGYSLLLLFIGISLGCLGGPMYYFGSKRKEKQYFDRLWASTSGELVGHVYFVYQTKKRLEGIKLHLSDGTLLYITYSDESTGYIPEWKDLVKITIDRKKRAIKTELVEKASNEEILK